MKTGKIIQVLGPVVDVEFENQELPAIRDALEVQNGDKKCVMEVAQHIGNHVVRCIMLAASEGLHRDMEVTAEGSGIKVPVGEKTLGRLFNVLGETIDDGEPIKDAPKMVIHREPPTFEEQNPAVEILETGIKVIDLLAPYAKGGKIGLFDGVRWYVWRAKLFGILLKKKDTRHCLIMGMATFHPKGRSIRMSGSTATRKIGAARLRQKPMFFQRQNRRLSSAL